MIKFQQLLENYQAEMAKRAVANGFLFGKGPGKGHVKNDLYEIPTSLDVPLSRGNEPFSVNFVDDLR